MCSPSGIQVMAHPDFVDVIMKILECPADVVKPIVNVAGPNTAGLISNWMTGELNQWTLKWLIDFFPDVCEFIDWWAWGSSAQKASTARAACWRWSMASSLWLACLFYLLWLWKISTTLHCSLLRCFVNDMYWCTTQAAGVQVLASIESISRDHPKDVNAINRLVHQGRDVFLDCNFGG